MTKAELEKRLADQAERIAELEEELESESRLLERAEDELASRGDADDVALSFAALCQSLDAHLPFRQLLVRLRLDFETLAERLGVARPWCAPAPTNGRAKVATKA